MALTLEQKQYYDSLDDMFGTAGWKNMIEEAKTEIYQLQADALDIKPIPGVSMEYQLGRIQGRAEQLAYLTRLEEISDAQRALLEQDDADV